jgi:hypothetical protein
VKVKTRITPELISHLDRRLLSDRNSEIDCPSRFLRRIVRSTPIFPFLTDIATTHEWPDLRIPARYLLKIRICAGESPSDSTSVVRLERVKRRVNTSVDLILEYLPIDEVSPRFVILSSANDNLSDRMIQ